ncbi:MAG: nucleotide exchange factor GrpE [Actinomycetes bacterium]
MTTDNSVLEDDPVSEPSQVVVVPDATSGKLAELTEQVAGLRDLFARRLMEDKTKKAMFDELYSQMQFAKEGLIKSTIAPMISELLLVIDRIETSEDDSAMVQSVRDELLEVLARRGVQPIEATTGVPFDATIHQAVGAIDDDLPTGYIVAQERTGYRQGASLLRPAQVIVSR